METRAGSSRTRQTLVDTDDVGEQQKPALLVPAKDVIRVLRLQRHLGKGNPRVAWRVEKRLQSAKWQEGFPAPLRAYFFCRSTVEYVGTCESVCLTKDLPPDCIPEEYRNHPNEHVWGHGMSFVLTSVAQCDPMPTSNYFVTWERQVVLKQSPRTHTLVVDPR